MNNLASVFNQTKNLFLRILLNMRWHKTEPLKTKQLISTNWNNKHIKYGENINVTISYSSVKKTSHYTYTDCTETGMLPQSNTKHMILAAFFKLGVDQTIDTCKCEVQNMHGSVVQVGNLQYPWTTTEVSLVEGGKSRITNLWRSPVPIFSCSSLKIKPTYFIKILRFLVIWIMSFDVINEQIYV